MRFFLVFHSDSLLAAMPRCPGYGTVAAMTNVAYAR